jgi:indolepyruvate decarboxylase
MRSVTADNVCAARYVLRRLKAHGAAVLFGVPGTSCEKLFRYAESEGVKVVVNSSELEAGYAADGYARIRGLAAVSVSYGVGTLSLVNAIAGAFVERGPIVVVSGGPGVSDLWTERHLDALFAHSTGRPSTDLRVMEQVAAFAARAETILEVPKLVDCAITTALREQRPVYIEVAQDLWTEMCPAPPGMLDFSRPATGHEEQVAAAVVERLDAAVRPAILFGEEISRYRLQHEALAVLGQTGLPWATTLLGKGVLPEDEPNFVGVYDSDLAPKPVREVVENADLLLALGCVFGVDHSLLVKQSWPRIVHALDGVVRVQEQPPERAELAAFLRALANVAKPQSVARLSPAIAAGDYKDRRRSWAVASAEDTTSVTHEALFAEIDQRLSDGWFLVLDTCLGSYPGADLNIRRMGRFMGDPVWLSIGHSVGAAVGVSFAIDDPLLVICGDGGFQMTVQALSTLAKVAKRGQSVLVLVIDNGIYAIEQWLIDKKYFKDRHHPGLPFVRLNRWDYALLAKALGAKASWHVSDRETLRHALQEALHTAGLGVLSVSIDPRDLPPENRVPLGTSSPLPEGKNASLR